MEISSTSLFQKPRPASDPRIPDRSKGSGQTDSAFRHHEPGRNPVYHEKSRRCFCAMAKTGNQMPRLRFLVSSIPSA
jgi:hypothetical protein